MALTKTTMRKANQKQLNNEGVVCECWLRGVYQQILFFEITSKPTLFKLKRFDVISKFGNKVLLILFTVCFIGENYS